MPSWRVSLKIRPNRALSGCRTHSTGWPRAVDYRQSAVTHVWLWSVLGTSLYAFGIGLSSRPYSALRCFPITYRKGPSRIAEYGDPDGDVCLGRNRPGLWFNGGRLPFHLLAVVAGVSSFSPWRDCLIACANIRLPSGRGAVIFARSCRQALFLTL